MQARTRVIHLEGHPVISAAYGTMSGSRAFDVAQLVCVMQATQALG